MKLKIKATPLFQRIYESKKRVILNEGSSRSAKTYTSLQVLLMKMFNENNIVITVVRKTGPSLKATAYRDFLEILQNQGIYSPKQHNKSELTYKIRGNEIEFISVDDFKKVKGRKRDYLFMNEANECTYQDFTQLALRTTKQIYLDENPSHDDEHWIETKVKTRDDIEVIHSTYKDNPFIEDEVIREIERLEATDPNLWRIYGLGIRGIAEARIYTHFKLVDDLPEEYDEKIYCLDFGFNNPMCLLEIRIKDKKYYVKELIYQTGLLTADLIKKLEDLKVDKNKFMFCDSAEPDRIEEIHRAGYNTRKSDKDVKKGIDTVKSSEILITKDSINTLKESRVYSYKVTTDGKILEEPVKLNDHAMDTMRYGVRSYATLLNTQPNIRTL